jgi:hypothetical protein
LNEPKPKEKPKDEPAPQGTVGKFDDMKDDIPF